MVINLLPNTLYTNNTINSISMDRHFHLYSSSVWEENWIWRDYQSPSKERQFGERTNRSSHWALGAGRPFYSYLFLTRVSVNATLCSRCSDVLYWLMFISTFLVVTSADILCIINKHLYIGQFSIILNQNSQCYKVTHNKSYSIVC